MEKKVLNSKEKDYKSIYKTIQNEIKDYIINKLISITINLNKENIEIKKLNETLKKHLLYILKRMIITNNKNNLESKSKNKLNSSIKLTEFSNRLKTDYHNIISDKMKNSSIDTKICKTYKFLIDNGNNPSYLIKRNIPLNTNIINNFHCKSKSHLFTEKEINNSCFLNQSQKLTNYSINKKNSSEKKLGKYNLKYQSDLIYPKYRKTIYKYKYHDNNGYNSDEKIKRKKKNNIEEHKNLDKDFKNKIMKNPYTYSSSLLSNKI
jgi:hypothetical protein